MKTLDCPKCGAPLRLEDDARSTIECPYCNNQIVLPSELRREAAAPGNSPSHQPIDATRLAQLQDLIRSGRKIEAIKLLREWTGLGLKESKDIADALENNLSVNIQVLSGAPAASRPTAVDNAALEAQVRELLGRGVKIQAIKEVRQALDVGLADAKKLVDWMEQGQSLANAQERLRYEAERSRIETPDQNPSSTPRSLFFLLLAGAALLVCLFFLFLFFV